MAAAASQGPMGRTSESSDPVDGLRHYVMSESHQIDEDRSRPSATKYKQPYQQKRYQQKYFQQDGRSSGYNYSPLGNNSNYNQNNYSSNGGSWKNGNSLSQRHNNHNDNDHSYQSQSSWTRSQNGNNQFNLQNRNKSYFNDHRNNNAFGRSQDRSPRNNNNSSYNNRSRYTTGPSNSFFYGNNQGSNYQMNRSYRPGGGNGPNSNVSSNAPNTWKTRNGRNQQADNPREVFDDAESRISAGINFQSYDSIPVDLTGPNKDSITPLTSFEDLKELHPQLQQNIASLKYKNPTPVQKYCIPVLLEGHDLMACAQTGSGKTAAFLCPIISKMLATGPPLDDHRGGRSVFRPAYPVALILSPTRELALQIFKEARKFAFNTGIITHVVYGGSPYKDQVYSISRNGTDLCVATPGRLLELIDRGAVLLDSIRYLVLDEADRMLDMGFTPQIQAIINHNSMYTSLQGRQTIMLSATFPPPIQNLAAQFLREYMFLTVGRVGSTNEFIRQNFTYAVESNKPQLLMKVLRESNRGLTLIFVETRKKADIIETFLANSGFNTVCLHGEKTQMEREKALANFRSGKSPILVATDVAARGLDINHVEHVVNCDLPARIEDYVHRIGRTGRAGNAGKATSFVNEQNKPILKDLINLLQESQQDIPSWLNDLMRSCMPNSFQQQSYYNQNYRKSNRNYDPGSHYGRYPKPSYDDEEDGW